MHLLHLVYGNRRYIIIIALLNGAFRELCSSLCTSLDVDRGPELGTGVDGVVAKLLLDTEDLVELGKTLGAGAAT